MKCPTKVQIEETIYDIDTDFRTAIKCDAIARDESINEYERPLAIICTLFGEKALDNEKHYQALFEYALKYLRCGKEIQENDDEPDMDYNEDMPYIEASFMSDYHIDLQNEKMDWYKFSTLMDGLSSSDFGNCCILNKIRSGRKYDPNKITDVKEREKFIKWQQSIALNKKEHKKNFTEEEQNNMEEFYKQMGL